MLRQLNKHHLVNCNQHRGISSHSTTRCAVNMVDTAKKRAKKYEISNSCNTDATSLSKELSKEQA